MGFLQQQTRASFARDLTQAEVRASRQFEGFFELSHCQPVAMLQRHVKTFSFFSLRWVMHNTSFGLASASQRPGKSGPGLNSDVINKHPPHAMLKTPSP